jgi:hypothetical protein
LGLVLVAVMMPIVVMVGPAQPAQRGQVCVLPVQGNVYLAASASATAAFSVGEDGVLVVDTTPGPLLEMVAVAVRAT